MIAFLHLKKKIMGQPRSYRQADNCMRFFWTMSS